MFCSEVGHVHPVGILDISKPDILTTTPVIECDLAKLPVLV